MSLSARNANLVRNERTLVADMSVAVESGQVVSLIGPNGAGKTSLLRLLSGETQPSSGNVFVDEKEMEEIAISERATRIAVLPQHSVLDFPFIAREVIGMGRIPHFTGARQNAVIVDEILARMRIGDLAGQVYTTMSGGERQQIHIARILCQLWDRLDAGYFMFDEPTAPLDLAHQVRFLDLTRELADEGAGVLMVMHDINLACRCADTMILMHQGSLVASGTPVEVVTRENIRVAYDVEVDIAVSAAGTPVLQNLALAHHD